ncbi:hypothetical protein [Thermoanaerobacterium thermosaccharolyticum]
MSKTLLLKTTILTNIQKKLLKFYLNQYGYIKMNLKRDAKPLYRSYYA